MIKELNHAEIRGKAFQQRSLLWPSRKVIVVGKQKEGQSGCSAWVEWDEVGKLGGVHHVGPSGPQ